MADPFEEIYETYKNRIYSYLYHLTANSHTAEELTHDTFLKAFKSFKRFRGKSSIKTWLYTIARNTFINNIRKSYHKREHQMDPAKMHFVDQKNDIRTVHQTIYLEGLLQRLTEQEKSLIILRETNGLTYQEIAEILDITQGQVKIGLHRTRKKLKALYLKEREGED